MLKLRNSHNNFYFYEKSFYTTEQQRFHKTVVSASDVRWMISAAVECLIVECLSVWGGQAVDESEAGILRLLRLSSTSHCADNELI